MKTLLKKITLLFIVLWSSGMSAEIVNITLEVVRNEDNSATITFQKQLPGSYYVTVELSNTTNCNKVKYQKVIRSSTGTLARVKPIDSENPVNFAYSYTSIMGTPSPKVNTSIDYVIPSSSIHKVQLCTNANTKYFQSVRPEGWVSYIVLSEKPDTICCMRKGIVVEIDDTHPTKTIDGLECTTDMNSITIEHKDGTLATYEGFRRGMLMVDLGQRVHPSTPLGTMEMFTPNEYRFYFNVHMLSKDRLNDSPSQSLKDTRSSQEYIMPYFATPEGHEVIVNERAYKQYCTDEMFFKEFSRGEKRRYLKKH